MDLKISFLSVIRVIFFRRCFFTQILNSLYQGGQIFNISDRFYNYLGYGSSIYFISILIEFLYFTVFVSGLLAGNAISVSLILMIEKFYVPIGITKLLSFSDLFLSSFLLMSLYYHSLSNLSTLLFVFSLIIFLFLLSLY